MALLVASWTGAPDDVRADTFVLKDGEVVEGSIIDVTRNTVIIKRAIGGMRQTRLRDIDEVRLELAPGRQIVGQFVSWADGVYQLRTSDELIWISEGDVLNREPGAQASAQPAPSPPPTQPAGEQTVRMAAAPPVSTKDGAARVATARQEETAVRPSEDDTGQDPGEERNLAVLQDESPAAGATQSLAVKASVDPAEPGAENMVFRIELSRPAEQTVVLIYGTIDDTAKAGTDYESQQGMMTLAPGTRSAEVHVPLIENRPAGGEKRFELFLTADPKVAEVVDKRIVATIDGKD